MPENLVIIPTFNECENIETVLRKVFALDPGFSVLVVDDNSPDGTPEIVKQLQGEFPDLHLEIRKTKDGLGKAYTHGFKWALSKDYQFIFEMHADLSHRSDERRVGITCGSGQVSDCA